MTGSERVTWKAVWNPETNTTTITDNSGTRNVSGNQTTPPNPTPVNPPPPKQTKSRAGGISATNIISGQPTGGGYSPTGINTDSAPSNDDKSQTDNKDSSNNPDKSKKNRKNAN